MRVRVTRKLAVRPADSLTDCQQLCRFDQSNFAKYFPFFFCPAHLCDVCGKAFRRKATLDGHKKLHVQQVMHCTRCPFVANCRASLRRHDMRTHGDGSTLYACHLCDKTFKSADILNPHLRKFRPPFWFALKTIFGLNEWTHKLRVY